MPHTRLLACILLCCAACAPTRPQTPPGIQALLDQRRATIDQARSTALAPLNEWEAETPPFCTSPNLARAKSAVLAAVDVFAAENHGVDVATDAGTWMLTVADAARDHGCKQVARRLYDAVIATYIASAYTALRQRAQIGIDDLRQ